MNRPSLSTVTIAASVGVSLAAGAVLLLTERPPAGNTRLGTVHFPISCANVQEKFDHAVSLVHNFLYPETVKAFQAIIAEDPGCAMAYWGLAISQRPNPLVPPFPAANMKAAWDAIQQGKAAATKTPREAAYLEAMEIYYKDYDTVDHKTRVGSYEQAMQRVSEQYPDDPEARVFYALALNEAVDLNDKGLTKQRKAAAREYAAKNAPGTPAPRGPHGMDFRAYAYLQLGDDGSAKQVVEDAATVTSPPEASLTFDTALAAIPARYALERGQWEDAAQLAVRESRHLPAQSISRFARTIGAARAGRTQDARDELAELETIEQRLTAAGDEYWSGQSRIQIRAATAWILLSENRKDEAIAAMVEATDLDDASEKNIAMENKLVPMRELLGELYQALGMHDEALSAFDASLKTAPRRFRALAGAARAARAQDLIDDAKRHYGALIALVPAANARRPDLIEARTYLAQN
jgi:tetratricopeptide (TPR) repeat protein